MKILALLTDGFGSSGGIGRYNCDLMRALSQSVAVDGVLALPRFGGGASSPPEGVTQLPAISNGYLWALKAVFLSFRSGIDVIFCGHMNAAPFASFLSRITGKPLWVQAHGFEAWKDRGSRFRWFLSQATLVTSVSRHTKRKLLSWSDLDPDRVRVLPNTFDASFSDSDANSDLASRLGVEGKKVILTVGRLSSSEKYKGHDRIIRCIPFIRSEVPNIAYVIVGDGDDRERLEVLAKHLGVDDVVVFAGRVRDQELKNYYALSDVFAMPSTGEGFGIVFLEAAAVGLPVIGGNQDGSVDALADGAIGVVLDLADCSALTVALIEALLRSDSRSLDAIARFSSKNFSNHIDDLMRLLCDRMTI